MSGGAATVVGCCDFAGVFGYFLEVRYWGVVIFVTFVILCCGVGSGVVGFGAVECGGEVGGER